MPDEAVTSTAGVSGTAVGRGPGALAAVPRDVGVPKPDPVVVADGVVRAITHRPAEVFVAPIELRLASTLATVAPALSATIQKKLDVANRR